MSLNLWTEISSKNNSETTTIIQSSPEKRRALFGRTVAVINKEQNAQTKKELPDLSKSTAWQHENSLEETSENKKRTFEQLEAPVARPVPVLGGYGMTVNLTIPKTPATPCKKQRKEKPLSLFQTLCQQAKSGSIVIQNYQMTLSYLAQGSYMDVHKIKTREPQLFPISNEQWIIKTCNEIHASKPEATVRKILSRSMEHYREAVNDGLKVAEILNAETAVEDGYIVQKYIEHAVDLDDENQMKQVRQFFLFCLKNQRRLDLLPSNLRVNGEGEVILVDFAESKEKSHIFVEQAVRVWCIQRATQKKMDRTQVTQYIVTFTKGFEALGYPADMNNHILDMMFPYDTENN